MKTISNLETLSFDYAQEGGIRAERRGNARPPRSRSGVCMIKISNLERCPSTALRSAQDDNMGRHGWIHPDGRMGLS